MLKLFQSSFKASKNSIDIIWKQFISSSKDELINQVISVERNKTILIDHCMIC